MYRKTYEFDNPAFDHNVDDTNNSTITNDNTNSLEHIAPIKEGWNNQLQFLMSCIAMSVGLGNIWRFPFVAYENGGGAFMIPYIIILIFVGRPIYYLEMCLGQFTSKGNAKLFETMAPALKGIGYGQILGTTCIATYYCSLLSLATFYFINSFTNTLPWSYCREEWQEENELKNVTCIPSTSNGGAGIENGITSDELYFRREVLKEKSYIDDGIGYPEWRLVLCLIFVWCSIFAITRNGIKSSGKASYFLALFPYVIILTLFIRSITLDGSVDGIIYLFKPEWKKLQEPEVWYAAVTQCFFSLNVGLGTITAYASYNEFTHNIYRDVNIITALDTFTSLAAGSTIFGVLGNLAKKQNVSVSMALKTSGSGLAFISYPEAIARFDVVPWLFSLLFFLMLFVVGLGCLVAMQACLYTAIIDQFPGLTRWKVALGISIVGFCIGLVYITPGGQFILTLVDHFGGTFITYLSNIFLIIAVAWFYGLEKMCIDAQFMLKRSVGLYWRLSWGVLTPVVLLTIFIYFVVTMKKLQHEGKEFPTIALVFGWLIVAVAILQIFVWWGRFIYKNRKLGFAEALKESLSDKDFTPRNQITCQEWMIEKERKLEALNNLTAKEYILHLLTGYKIKKN